jgi:hypothetical protein
MQPDSVSAAIVSSPADGNVCCECTSSNEGHEAVSGAAGGARRRLEIAVGTRNRHFRSWNNMAFSNSGKWSVTK